MTNRAKATMALVVYELCVTPVVGYGMLRWVRSGGWGLQDAFVVIAGAIVIASIAIPNEMWRWIRRRATDAASVPPPQSPTSSRAETRANGGFASLPRFAQISLSALFGALLGLKAVSQLPDTGHPVLVVGCIGALAAVVGLVLAVGEGPERSRSFWRSVLVLGVAAGIALFICLAVSYRIR